MKALTTVSDKGFIEGGYDDKYHDLQMIHAVAQAMTDVLAPDQWQRVVNRADEIMRDRFRVRD